jgi:hypothetical protein
VEDPTLLAGSDIEGPHGSLAAKAAHDQHILVGDTGCVQARAEIDRTILAKPSNGFAGLRI